MLCGCVVGFIRSTRHLNIANQATKNICSFHICSAIRRGYLCCWAILPNGVDNLVAVLGGCVDSEANALISLAVFADLIGPLPSVVTIPHDKTCIFLG